MRVLLLAAAVSVVAACGSRTEPAPPTREPEAPAPLPTLAAVEAARTLRDEQTREGKEWLSVFAAYGVKQDEAWKRAHPGDPKATRTQEEWEAQVTGTLPNLTRHPALPFLAATEAALRKGDEAAARSAWADAQARMRQATLRLETVRRLAAEHGLAR